MAVLISILKAKLNFIYEDFFKQIGVNKDTGLLNLNPSIKFAAYPYIGSKYGTKIKILVVGLDIGSDESINKIMDYNERRHIIEDKDISKYNPHIAGTYISALYFLKETMDWNSSWIKVKNISTCQKTLKKKYLLPKDNPLSYISFTNYYKFVTINRTKRTGGENRRYLDKKLEEDLLMQEVDILKPDIIIFQGKQFFSNKYNELILKLKKVTSTIFICPHPSYRGKGKREPEYFIQQFKKI